MSAREVVAHDGEVLDRLALPGAVARHHYVSREGSYGRTTRFDDGQAFESIWCLRRALCGATSEDWHRAPEASAPCMECHARACAASASRMPVRARIAS